MRLFNVFNKRGRAGWWFAPDPDTACQLAFEVGRARKRENLRAEDITDWYLDADPDNKHGLRDVLAREVTGIGSLVLNPIRGDLFFETLRTTGAPPKDKPAQWQVEPQVLRTPAPSPRAGRSTR